MYFLIYSSYAQTEFTHSDLKALLVQSREKNKQLNISGMLLYLEGKFIQFLEGEENEVKLLYHKINQDKRHKSVVLLKDGASKELLFKNWTMAFSSVTPEELASGAGFEKVSSVAALQIFKKLAPEF